MPRRSTRAETATIAEPDETWVMSIEQGRSTRALTMVATFQVLSMKKPGWVSQAVVTRSHRDRSSNVVILFQPKEA